MSKNIVLVIGAGASKDFNQEMGIGADLIQNTSDRVTDRTARSCGKSPYLVNLLEEMGFNQNIREKFVQCVDKYKSKGRSIDYFLNEVNRNPDFKSVKKDFDKIGTFSIVFHILGYEGACKSSFNKHSWLDELNEFVVKLRLNTWSDRLVDFKIVTFNYDRLIEEFLYRKHGQVIEEFINNSLVHVYNKIAPLTWQEKDKASFNDGFLEFGHRNNDVDGIVKYKDFIILMYNDRQDNNHLKRAKQLILNADMLFFLGYGYDKYNNENLGLMDTAGKTFIANYFIPEWNAKWKGEFEQFKKRTIWDKHKNQSIYTTENCTDFIRFWLHKSVLL